MSSSESSFVAELGVLPRIGMEMELVILKNGRVVRDEDELCEVLEELKREGFCGYVETFGSLPPRLEITLCKPIKDVRKIVEYYRKLIEKLRELGYEVKIRWGKYSGSIHVTLDDSTSYDTSLSAFTVSDLALLFDAFSDEYTCRRIATYMTLTPCVGGRVERKLLVLDEERGVAISEKPIMYSIAVAPFRNSMPQIANELTRAVKDRKFKIKLIRKEAP